MLQELSLVEFVNPELNLIFFLKSPLFLDVCNICYWPLLAAVSMEKGRADKAKGRGPHTVDLFSQPSEQNWLASHHRLNTTADCWFSKPTSLLAAKGLVDDNCDQPRIPHLLRIIQLASIIFSV